MLQKPNGYDDVQVATKLPRLPIGGYIIKVMNVKVENYTNGSILVLQHDIVEGEHAGFYKKNYDMQTQENKKWKGTLRLSIPMDGDEEWKVASFKRSMQAFEKSNNGFAWNWDEMALKGKIVGALFRNKEYALENGNRGMYTECFMAIPADDVRNGNFEMPKDKMLSGGSTAPSLADQFQDNSGYNFTNAPLQDDDIPF